MKFSERALCAAAMWVVGWDVGREPGPVSRNYELPLGEVRPIRVGRVQRGPWANEVWVDCVA
eukprot:4047611-Pyramimonas_sp.AAC.1